MESQRDFVGYADSPPDIRWPGGERLAINFVLNYEEGSEYSIEDGDGRSDATLTEVSQPRVPRGSRDLGAESMFEYGVASGSGGSTVSSGTGGSRSRFSPRLWH